MKNKSLLHDILQLRVLFFQKDRIRFVVLFGLMFVGSILEAVGVGIIPGFVAFLMKPSSLTKVGWLGSWTASLPETPTLKLMVIASLLLIVFVVAKSLFLAFVYYVQNRIVNGFRVRLSCRMFEAYQAASYEWLLQRSSSELQRNILVDTSQIIFGVVMPLLDLLMAFLMTVFIVVAMLLSTSAMTLLGAAIIGVGVLLVTRFFKRRLERAGDVLRREGEVIIQSIQQGFGAVVDARLTGADNYLAERFRRSMIMQAKMQITKGSILRVTPLAIEVVAMIGLLSVFLVIASSKGTIIDALPVMSLLGVATIRLKQVATRVTGQVNMLSSSRAYIPGLIKDIKMLEEIEKRNAVRENRKSDARLANFSDLSVENVSYTYPNSESQAVNGVSLKLKRGESIAFVGPTGCGKSTLVNLILGLLEPKSGTIKVNGVDIFTNLDGWRRHLGYIPQTIFLLDDTIRANIAFGVPPEKVNEKQLAAVLKSACLDKFVATLPQGLDTVVGERGVLLSGGQRQRIGIARALYFEPEVLVMDEATSALDNKTETEVMTAIQNAKQDRTLIMVAHRLSTVEDCNRLYYFENGCVRNCGSYQELMNSSADFRGMARNKT